MCGTGDGVHCLDRHRIHFLLRGTFTFRVLQPSVLSISRAFSSSQTETWYPLSSSPPFSLPPAPSNPSLLCLHGNVYSKSSGKWDCIIYVFFCLAYFACWPVPSNPPFFSLSKPTLSDFFLMGSGKCYDYEIIGA